MKKIKLTQGKYTLVDNELFDYLNQFHWSVDGCGYPQRAIKTEKGWRPLRMHRDILKLKPRELADHINRNKLDNRLINLRKCNATLNVINRPINKNNKSGIKGIYWDKFTNKWRVEIMSNYKKIKLGRYFLINDAISARSKAERIYHAIS